MRWVEIIALRSAQGNLEAVEAAFLISIVHDHRTKGLEAIMVYRHLTMETDLSVHLHWNTGAVEPRGSKAARHLARVLKDYGLVNRSVWREEAVDGKAAGRDSEKPERSPQ